VVGFIVFLIIVVVQFVVITKGSERWPRTRPVHAGPIPASIMAVTPTRTPA
jgi:hypothetical protein